MDKKDPNYIVLLERKIQEKYGEESIENPASHWTEDKEKEYLEQIKIISSKEQTQKEEIIENQDYLIQKKLFNKKNAFLCSKCKVLTKYISDDLYMNKYGMCYNCYLKNEDKLK